LIGSPSLTIRTATRAVSDTSGQPVYQPKDMSEPDSDIKNVSRLVINQRFAQSLLSAATVRRANVTGLARRRAGHVHVGPNWRQRAAGLIVKNLQQSW